MVSPYPRSRKASAIVDSVDWTGTAMLLLLDEDDSDIHPCTSKMLPIVVVSTVDEAYAPFEHSGAIATWMVSS